ncbi:MAG: HAMP domain-containing protein [Chlamydiota bacterium]
MLIRSKLLLYLLPPTIGSILLITSIFFFRWHHEIVEGYESKLQATLHSCTQGETLSSIEKNLASLKQKLQLLDLYLEAPSKHPSVTELQIVSSNGKMTGLFPYQRDGIIQAILVAEVETDKKLKSPLPLMVFGILGIIFLLTLLLFFLSTKIALPVQRLNNSALSIAAGQYGESIHVKGPKEISDLSNTLNTLSECLHENLNRLKENSLMREKMYGEHECATLLQSHMLQKVIDECTSDFLALQVISLYSSTPRGLLLDISEENPLHLYLVEAQEDGFQGMYHLLTEYKLFKENRFATFEEEFSFAHLSIDKESHGLHFQEKNFTTPYLWSSRNKKLISFTQWNGKVEVGDFFFFYTAGLQEIVSVEEFLTKILKFFGEDGLETTLTMLQKELALCTKRKELKKDIHLLCAQVLY